jgi:hypothetical protein
VHSQPSPRLSGLFRLANLAVLPGWALMLFAPRSRLTRRLINDDALFIGLGGVYAAMLGGALAENPAGGAALMNPTLESIGNMFKHGGPKATFAGWVHYLVFDFFVGRSILQDSQARGVPHALIVPALLLTLMSGPIGLAYYRILLRLRGKR